MGCGSKGALLCPICTELETTSWFCCQECFAKNWEAHSKIHDTLKKKQAQRALSKCNVDIPKDNNVATSKDNNESRNLPNSDKKRVSEVPGSNCLSSSGSRTNPKPPKDAPEDRTRPVGLHAVRDMVANMFMLAHVFMGRSHFVLKGMLLILSLVIMTAGGLFYSESMLSLGPQEMDKTLASGQPDDSEQISAGDAVDRLQQDVNTLHRMVEVHEKKIRYILDRYMEKLGADAVLNESAMLNSSVDARPASLEEFPINQSDLAGLLTDTHWNNRGAAGVASRKRKDDSWFGAAEDEIAPLREAQPEV